MQSEGPDHEKEDRDARLQTLQSANANLMEYIRFYTEPYVEQLQARIQLLENENTALTKKCRQLEKENASLELIAKEEPLRTVSDERQGINFNAGSKASASRIRTADLDELIQANTIALHELKSRSSIFQNSVATKLDRLQLNFGKLEKTVQIELLPLAMHQNHTIGTLTTATDQRRTASHELADKMEELVHAMEHLDLDVKERTERAAQPQRSLEVELLRYENSSLRDRNGILKEAVVTVVDGIMRIV